MHQIMWSCGHLSMPFPPPSHVAYAYLNHTWYNSISNLVSLITKTKLGLSPSGSLPFSGEKPSNQCTSRLEHGSGVLYGAPRHQGVGLYCATPRLPSLTLLGQSGCWTPLWGQTMNSGPWVRLCAYEAAWHMQNACMRHEWCAHMMHVHDTVTHITL
jgi:hypothetical protein